MTFRDNLQYLRAQRGMTQEQLAMLLGVSRQSISKWESEKAYPEMDKLLMVCDLFGCTLDDLVLADVRNPGSGSGITMNNHSTDQHVGDAAGQEQQYDSSRQPVVNDVQGNDGIQQTAATHAAAATSQNSGVAEIRQTSQETRHEQTAQQSQLSGSEQRLLESVGPQPGNTANATNTANTAGTTSETNPSTPVWRGSAPMGLNLAKDVTGYDEHMRKYAWKITIGVSCFILGTAFGVLFDGRNSPLQNPAMSSFMQVLCILLGVVFGLALIIPAGIDHANFKRKHPFVEDFYTEDDKVRASRLTAICLTGGIGLILVGVMVVIYANQMMNIEEGWPVSVLLFAAAIGVGAFIYSGMRTSMLKIDQYNNEVTEEQKKTLRESNNDDFYGKLSGSICGIIMMVATIIALIALFTTRSIFGMPFWLMWPLGGVLCGIVSIITGLFRNKNERNH